MLLGIWFTKVEPRADVGNCQFQQYDLLPILEHIVLSELNSLIQSLSTELDLLVSNHDIILEHNCCIQNTQL